MNTQSQSQGFLNAIIDNPDDDLPRLVFADYLEEAGASERAEFIRIQCELAAGVGDPARQKSLEDRQSELLAKHMEAWRVPIRGHQKFERGFVDSLWASADNLLHASSEIITSSTVRTLRISNADQRIDDLAEYPGFRNIEHLDLTNNNLSGDYRLRTILSNPHLGKLRGLNLHNNRIWADDVLRIARSPVAKQLTHLDLSGNGIGNDGVANMTTEVSFDNLEDLNLRSDGLPEYESILESERGLRSLVESKKKLRHLDISGHRIGEGGFMHLFFAVRRSVVRSLDVSSNRLQGLGLGFVKPEGFVENPDFRVLNFSRNEIDNFGARTMLRWDYMKNMDEFRLTDCTMDDETRKMLLASPYAPKFHLNGDEL